MAFVNEIGLRTAEINGLHFAPNDFMSYKQTLRVQSS
jgi:hypothetical protein